MATFSTLYTELGARLQDAAHSVWTLAQKKRFINGAIRNANDAGSFRIVTDSTSLDIIADTVDYALPAAILTARNLFRVSLEQGTGEPYAPVSAWTVQSHSAYTSGVEGITLTLRFSGQPDGDAGDAIKLEYTAKHQELSADADTTVIPEEYLYAYAMFLAHTETRTTENVDRKYHLEEAQKWYQVAEKELTKHLRRLPHIGGRIVPMVWD